MKMFWVIFTKGIGEKFKSNAQILTIENIEEARGWAEAQLAINKYTSYRIKPY